MNSRLAPHLCFTPQDDTQPVAQALVHAPGLNTSALLSMWLLAGGCGSSRSSVVQALMKAHGWTSLRAWRHWRGYSRAQVARRLGVHPATYELIEDGTVELGPWLLPAVEKILID